MMLSSLPVSRSRSRRPVTARMLTVRQSLEDQIYKQFLKDIKTPANLWEFDITVTLQDSWKSGGGLFSVLIQCFRPGEKIRPLSQTEASPHPVPVPLSRIAWAGEFEQLTLIADPLIHAADIQPADNLKDIIQIIATRALFRVLSKNFAKDLQRFEKEPTYEEIAKAIGLEEFKETIPENLERFKETVYPRLEKEERDKVIRYLAKSKLAGDAFKPEWQESIKQNTKQRLDAYIQPYQDLLESTDLQETIQLLHILESRNNQAKAILATMKTLKNPYLKYYVSTFLEKILQMISNVQYYERNMVTKFLKVLKPKFKSQFASIYTQYPTSYILLKTFGVYANGKPPAVIMTLADESVNNILQKPMYRYTVFIPYTDKVTLSDITSNIRLYQANTDNWELANLEDIFLDVFTLPDVTFEMHKMSIDLLNPLDPKLLERGSFSIQRLDELEEGLLDVFRRGNILKLKESDKIHEYVKAVNDGINQDIKRELDRNRGELERLREKLRV